MDFSRTVASCALAAALLGACASTPAGPVPPAADMQIASPLSILDAAITAAGGAASLSRVKELYWTGAAKVTKDGKTEEQTQAVLVRPFSFFRLTSWAKGAEPKTAKTIQAEQGKAWDVTRVTWQPMAEAGARFENELLSVYSLMLLTPLTEPGVALTEAPVGPDGSRALKAVRPGAPAVEMEFDAAGKLLRAGYVGTDPATGAQTTDVFVFAGEIASNGVKWPSRIRHERNGALAYEIELATFEALPEKTVRPLAQAMQYDPNAQPGDGDAG